VIRQALRGRGDGAGLWVGDWEKNAQQHCHGSLENPSQTQSHARQQLSAPGSGKFINEYLHSMIIRPNLSMGFLFLNSYALAI